jgi:hypothetical protein
VNPRILPIRSLIPALLGLAFLAAGRPAGAVHVQTYVYDFQCGDQRKLLSLKVETMDGTTVVTYRNEFDDTEISTYDADDRMLTSTYLDPAGRETARSRYDYARGTVTLRGLIQAEYRLLPRTYDNNGSLFYLFGRILPAPGQKQVCYLVQSNLSRVEDPFLRWLVSQLVGPVEMAFADQSAEPIQVLERSVSTRRYVLYIHNPRLAAFWPNQYHFWYTEDDRRLVRYQGLNADRKVNMVTLVDYYEREYPTPALPSL